MQTKTIITIRPAWRYIFIACVSLILNSHFSPASAQQPWNFASIGEACLDDAYFIEPPAEVKAVVEEAAGVRPTYNTVYHLSGLWRQWGRNYVRFQNAEGADFRVPEDVAALLLPHLVSCRYWQRRFETLLLWSYLNTEKLTGLLEADTADRRYGRYTPIRWLGYSFQPSEQWPVVLTVTTNTRTPQTLSLHALERLAEWGAFATEADMSEYERHNEQLRQSEADRRADLQRALDSLSSISDWAERHADSLILALQADSVSDANEQMQAEVERTKERMNRDEIFIMNIKPARSEYMFGVELNLYNCYDKTISKIELTVTPYNDRGQVQSDKFQRTVRTVRCMGPIRPGAPAQYLFDELFWNDRGRIKYMRVTGITFHFTDGTHRSFSGYNQILKHSLR